MKYIIRANIFDNNKATIRFWTEDASFRIFFPMRFKEEGFFEVSRSVIGDHHQKFDAFKKDELSPDKGKLIDEGECFKGAEKSNFIEFFLPNSDWIVGRHLFRYLNKEDITLTDTDEKLLGDSKHVWFYMTTKYQVPYIFSKSNKDFEYIPFRRSALPKKIEEDLEDKDLAFWKSEDVKIEKAKEYTLENWEFMERERQQFGGQPWKPGRSS